MKLHLNMKEKVKSPSEERVGVVVPLRASLLPCPFCGGKAEPIRWHNGDCTTVFIRCSTCGSGTEPIHVPQMIGDYEKTLRESADVWNGRR